MDEDFGDWEEDSPSARVTFLDFAAVGVGLLKNITVSGASFLGDVQDLLLMHANFKAEQRAFQQEAALEIETITNQSQPW